MKEKKKTVNNRIMYELLNLVEFRGTVVSHKFLDNNDGAA